MSLLSDKFNESLLGEMALGEMSLQSPAKSIKQHIEYSNKYSVTDVQKLFNLSANKVFNDNYPYERFSRVINSIANILLSDFESDIDEWGMNFGLEDNEAKEIIDHYMKYVNIFNSFYDECENECLIVDGDKDFIGLRDSVKSSYELLYNGMKNFIVKEYPMFKKLL